jgi:hypothetical protein
MKDKIWEEIKEDKDTVYGISMLDAFLRTTEYIEERHYEELSKDKKKLVSPTVLLSITRDTKEAEYAIKAGADVKAAISQFARGATYFDNEKKALDRHEALMAIISLRSEELNNTLFHNIMEAAIWSGITDMLELMVSVPMFKKIVNSHDEDIIWDALGAAKPEMKASAGIVVDALYKAVENNEQEMKDKDIDPDENRLARIRLAKIAKDRGMWKELWFIVSMHSNRSIHSDVVPLAAAEGFEPGVLKLAIDSKIHGTDDETLLYILGRISGSRVAPAFVDDRMETIKSILDALSPNTEIPSWIAKDAEGNKNHDVAELIRKKMKELA